MTSTEARDCRVYHRRSPQATHVPLPGLLTLAEARTLACKISSHPLQALRPFYTAVYDGQNAYPVAVYQNGAELAEEATVAVLTHPHAGRQGRAPGG